MSYIYTVAVMKDLGLITQIRVVVVVVVESRTNPAHFQSRRKTVFEFRLLYLQNAFAQAGFVSH